MAQSSDGGNRPPPDLLLTDISSEEPEAKTRSATSPRELPANELEPDAPSKPGDEPSSGVERSARAGAGSEKESGELRDTEDETLREPRQSHDDLIERLGKIEAVVGELPALREKVAEGVVESRLVRLAVVGMSKETDELKGTASRVDETVADLKKLSSNLKLSERRTRDKLDRATRIEDDVTTVKKRVDVLCAVNGVVVVLFVLTVWFVLSQAGALSG